MKLLPSFRIEGLGFDKANQMAADLAYRWEPSHGLPAVADIPGTVKTRLSVETGAYTLDAHSPVIHGGPPRAGDPDPAAFLDPSPSSSTTLESDLADTLNDDTVKLAATGLDGRVVWVGPEAIKLGTGDGTGTYSGCTRGMWRLKGGRSAYRHTAGDVVWLELQAIKGRRIELLTRVGDITKVSGAGLIKNVQKRRSGAIIKLDVASYFDAVLGDVKIGPASLRFGEDDQATIPQDIRRDWRYVRNNPNLSAEQTVIRTQGVLSDRSRFTPYVYKPDTWANDDKPRALQVGQALIAGDGDETDYAARRNSQFDTDVQGGEDDPSEEYVTQQVRPVGWFGRYATNFPSDPSPLVATDSISPTRNLDHPHHPATIAAAIFQSYLRTPTEDTGAFDVLANSFAMGLDVDIADGLRDRFSSVLVDSLVIGWDGEGSTASDLILRKLLRNYGLILGINQDGSATIRRYGLPSIVERDAADIIHFVDDGITTDQQLTDTADEVSFVVGEQPWSDDSGRKTTVPFTGQATIDRRERSENDVEIKIPGIDERNAERYFGFFTAQAIRKAEPNMAIAGKVNPPHISSVDSLDIGRIYRLGDLPVDPSPLVDDDGDRYQPSDIPGEVAVRLVGRSYNAGADHYEITVEVIDSPPVRHRAPAMIARSVGGDNGLKVYTDTTTNFAADYDGTGTGTDTDGFVAGHTVRFYDGSMRPVSASTYTIDAVGSDGTGPFVRMGSDAPASTDLPALMRLAYLGTEYQPNGSNVLDSGRRLWVFIGRTPNNRSAVLGPDNEDADIYGV